MKVQHKGKPGEPWGRDGEFGTVASYKDGGATRYRIAPSGRGIPAQAYVNWGDYYTWEKIVDLRFL